MCILEGKSARTMPLGAGYSESSAAFYSVTSAARQDFYSKARPLCAPVILGAPSVATDTRWVVFMSWLVNTQKQSRRRPPQVSGILVVSAQPFLFVAQQNSHIDRTALFVRYHFCLWTHHKRLSRLQLN